MSLKLRAFIWGGVLLMGVSLYKVDSLGTALAQMTEDVVVIPEQRTVRAIGDVFRDCAECPEVVILPPGSFLMGSVRRGMDTAPGLEEMPQHLVTIGQPIAVGRYEVTFVEWDACVAEGGCNGYKHQDEKWGRGNRPVINVDWNAAQSYVSWLSRKTGKPYRLLSEAEWEYAARAGTTTRNYWGDDNHPKSSAVCAYANVGRSTLSCAKDGRDITVPVGSFRPNNFGLYDVIGNVQEWTADCWNDRYDNAPSDGRAWLQGDCTYRVTRGGSWHDYYTRHFRSAARHYVRANGSASYIGFRVARTMAVAPNPYREQYPRREQRPPREHREPRDIVPKEPSRERPKSRAP